MILLPYIKEAIFYSNTFVSESHLKRIPQKHNQEFYFKNILLFFMPCSSYIHNYSLEPGPQQRLVCVHVCVRVRMERKCWCQAYGICKCSW